MQTRFEIISVDTPAQLKEFIQFPHRLYQNDTFYVPMLNIYFKSLLSKKNPFLKHSRIALFMARDGDQTVGRIAAIYNKTHLDIYNDKTGFFGFFDCIDDQEVASALFQSAFEWLKMSGLDKMVGPTNLTTNDSCGLLVEGFDQPPMVLMPYNFPYYKTLCEKAGMKKLIDLFSWEVDGTGVIRKYSNILDRSEQKMADAEIVIRPISQKNFSRDIDQLQKVYNECNKHHWGFIPLSNDEFRQMAKELIQISYYDLSLVIERKGEIIGYIIAVPNINQALKYVKNGRLFPFGIFKLLYYQKQIRSARIMILGLLKEHSGTGIDMVMYKKIKEALNKRNIFSSEACYVMETNMVMNSILGKIDGKCIKTYRMYEMRNGLPEE